MATITQIDLGLAPIDGLGDKLRIGGNIINENFTNLNTDKLERGGYTGTAQDLEDAINAIDLSGYAQLATTNTFTQTQTMAKLILTSTTEALNVTDGVDTANGLSVEFSDATHTYKYIQGVLISRTAL